MQPAGTRQTEFSRDRPAKGSCPEIKIETIHGL